MPSPCTSDAGNLWTAGRSPGEYPRGGGEHSGELHTGLGRDRHRVAPVPRYVCSPPGGGRPRGGGEAWGRSDGTAPAPQPRLFEGVREHGELTHGRRGRGAEGRGCAECTYPAGEVLLWGTGVLYYCCFMVSFPKIKVLFLPCSPPGLKVYSPIVTISYPKVIMAECSPLKGPTSEGSLPTRDLPAGESQGERSLANHSPWGHKRVGRTEQLSMNIISNHPRSQ